MKVLRYCKKCKIYTLKLRCPKCGASTVSPHPPKFSIEDKYARYRRKEKFGNLS